MIDADAVEKRVYDIVRPWNGRSWLTFKMPSLNGDTSLNHTMGDAANLLI